MIIVQISDMHLRPENDLVHGAVDTEISLAAAVAAIGRLRPAPDVILASGDLADLGRPADYQLLRRLLAPLPAPVYLIPGNRDRRSALRDEFAGDGCFPGAGPFLHYVVDRFPVRLIGLDTVLEEEKTGAMCGERLDWLEGRLAEAPDRPTVIFMHHPPFATGVPFMDRQVFVGAAAMEALVRRHPHVVLVTSGHMHRPIQRTWAGTAAAVCPSTAFHMPLDLTEGALGVMLEPAAGFLHVWRNGAIITHGLPLAAHRGPLPFQRHRGAEAAAD